MLPLEWREPSTLSDWTRRLTPARARELTRALDDLVTGWEDDEEDTEGAEEFVVTLHAFPRPGKLGADQEDRA
jgi:hypothetical protein